MARLVERLLSAKVKHAKPGLHPDGGDLYLQVTASKGGHINKSSVFRFAIAGRERRMGLGSLNAVGLAETLDKARECRLAVLDGKGPIDNRNALRTATAIAKAKSMAFAQCATAYMSAHEAGWRDVRHRDQWRASLQTYAFAVLVNLPVADIDTGASDARYPAGMD
jgi:hypothetical protein